jgi:hypothetical protein
MKLKYQCGCQYEIAGSFADPDDSLSYDNTYVDDDGNDFELCQEHEAILRFNE